MFLSVFSDLWYLGDWELESWSTIIEITQYVTAIIILYLCTLHANDMVKKSDFSYGKDTKTKTYFWFLFWVLASVALAFIGKRIDNKISENAIEIERSDNREYQDRSTKNLVSEFGKYGLEVKTTYDANTKSLNYKISQMELTLKDKVNTSEKLLEQTPNLTETLQENTNNPVLQFDVVHIFAYVQIRVIEDETAKLKSVKHAFIAKINNSFSVIYKDILPYKYELSQTISAKFSPQLCLKSSFKDYKESYLYFQIEYANNNNILQEPFIRIFKIPNNAKHGEVLYTSADEKTETEILSIMKNKF